MKKWSNVVRKREPPKTHSHISPSVPAPFKGLLPWQAGGCAQTKPQRCVGQRMQAERRLEGRTTGLLPALPAAQIAGVLSDADPVEQSQQQQQQQQLRGSPHDPRRAAGAPEDPAEEEEKRAEHRSPRYMTSPQLQEPIPLSDAHAAQNQQQPLRTSRSAAPTTAAPAGASSAFQA